MASLGDSNYLDFRETIITSALPSLRRRIARRDVKVKGGGKEGRRTYDILLSITFDPGSLRLHRSTMEMLKIINAHAFDTR